MVFKYRKGGVVGIVREMTNKANSMLLTQKTNSIPATMIGGSTAEARSKYWSQEPVMSHAVDSIAKRYNIDPMSLRYRLDREGFTDDQINRRNHQIKSGNKVTRGYELLNEESSGGTILGLDDARDYIDSGKVKPINESWFDARDFKNEQGRITHPVNPDTNKDAIGIVAAHLKYFKDSAKEDFPNSSEYDLNRYSNAYYNRGRGGGRRWVKSGAKGYKFNAGGLMRVGFDFYKDKFNKR